MKFNAEKGIVIAGHRGNPAKFTENILESFKSAVDLGADMIETDIHLSADGKLVLMHDANAERTTGTPGLLREMSFNEIRALRVGREKALVPTLEELLETFADNKSLLYDLEIKVYSHVEGKDAVHYTVDKTVELCRKHNICDRVLFNSFDTYVLEYIHKKYGKEFLTHGYYPYTIMKNVTLDPCTYLDYACFWKAPDEAKEAIDYLLSNGIAPCTGSDTSEEDFYEYARMGCTMFTENDPESALKWRKNLD